MADDRVRTSTVRFAGADGAQVLAHFAEPERTERFPGLVLIHGATGVSESLKQQAAELARLGYLVVIPDLYSRIPSPDLSSLERAMQILQTIPDSQVVGDLEGGASFLKARNNCSGRLGAVALGGRYGYVFACRTRSLDVAVVCYGPLMKTPIDTPELRPLAPIEMAADLSCPLLGVYGMEDRNPSPEQVREFERQLRRSHKQYRIRSYPGAGHGFLNASSANYRPDAASAAWEEIRAWLRARLA